MRTIKELALIIAAKEGLKKQVNIAQILEILSILSDTIASDPSMDLNSLLIKNGEKRANKKKKAKKIIG